MDQYKVFPRSNISRDCLSPEMAQFRYGYMLTQCLVTGLILLSLQLRFAKSSQGQGRSIDPEIQRRIDEFVEQAYLPRSQISGMGLAIVRDNGELLYTTGYGLADKDKGIRNGNSTQFLIGSVTKSFTSLLVVKLLHERFPALGEAVLDTPIRTLLPEVGFTLIDRFRSEYVTFRDLLAHRVCLTRDDLILAGDPFNTTGEIVYRLRYNEEVCGIRGEAQYNNQLYIMAGELAGVLANKPYEEAMQDLLDDIGMTNSTFAQRTDDFSQMPYRAQPYYVKDNVTHPMNPELVKRIKLHNAAGGLFMPPSDFAIYMQFHLNMGKNLDGNQIIPRDVMEWTRKPSIAMNSNGFKHSEDDVIINAFGYGLGLILSSFDGWFYVQHSGYVAPYSSLMSLYPDKGLGIFSCTNMSPVRISQQALHAFIFELLNGAENPEGKAMELNELIQAAKEKVKREGELNLKEYHQRILEEAEMSNVKQVDIVGKYGSGSNGDAEVSERFNEQTNRTEYYFQYGRWFKGWLEEEEDLGDMTIYKLIYDTDIIQKEYADGLNGNSAVVAFDNSGALVVVAPTAAGQPIVAKFKLGASLDKLPPVPWTTTSCGKT